MLAFVQALDADYRTKGIRANAILPSVIDTPANRAAEPDADHSKWVQPAEIARVVRFLVSDDSARHERRRDPRLRPRVVAAARARPSCLVTLPF